MGSTGRATSTVEGAGEAADAPPLSDVIIVRAAREIIAESGVEGLTMRRLSARLGVALGATYHHVPTKRALMKLVAADLYREVELPLGASGDWAEQVKEMIVSTARVVGQYPGMAAYVMTQVDDIFPLELNASLNRVLRDAGFSSHSIRVLMGALYFYGTGISTSLLPLREAKTLEGTDVTAIFEEGLEMLLGGARLQLERDLARGKQPTH
jgi:AcrR family transcriptional regulator